LFSQAVTSGAVIIQAVSALKCE